MPSSFPGPGAWADGQGPLGVVSAQPFLFVFEQSSLCRKVGTLGSCACLL